MSITYDAEVCTAPDKGLYVTLEISLKISNLSVVDPWKPHTVIHFCEPSQTVLNVAGHATAPKLIVSIASFLSLLSFHLVILKGSPVSASLRISLSHNLSHISRFPAISVRKYFSHIPESL